MPGEEEPQDSLIIGHRNQVGERQDLFRRHAAVHQSRGRDLHLIGAGLEGRRTRRAGGTLARQVLACQPCEIRVRILLQAGGKG